MASTVITTVFDGVLKKDIAQRRNSRLVGASTRLDFYP
jgi:ribosomal protein S20